MNWKIKAWKENENGNQRNESKETYSFQKSFCIKKRKTTYKEVRDISDIKKIDLPNKNETLKILTSNNTNSIKILKIFDIIELSIVFAVIDKFAVDALKQIKIKTVIARANQNVLLSKIAETIKCEKLKKKKIHMKLYLIKTKDSKYVINSSANPKISDYTELYVIDNSTDLYNKLSKIIEII